MPADCDLVFVAFQEKTRTMHLQTRREHKRRHPRHLANKQKSNAGENMQRSLVTVYLVYFVYLVY